MKKTTIVIPALLVAAMVPLVAMRLKPEKRPGSRPESAPTVAAVPVTTTRPEVTAEGAELTLPGRVKASEEVTITSQLPARLTLLPVREGQSFRAGQTLAVFDSPEARQSLESARAGLASAALTRDQSRRQAARIDSLLKSGVASVRQLEMAEADREAAEARVAEAEAGLENWQQNTKLNVPFDGIVVRRYVDPGALLSPGQPILDVRSSTVSEIEVAVPESELPRLSGGRAWYQVGETGWREANVVRVDGMIDFRTRTRVAHLKPVDATGLEAGAYARIRFEGAEDPPAAGGQMVGGQPAGGQTITVPARSLIRRGSLSGVFVVKDGQAWLRWLRIGRALEDKVEVLAGLLPDDQIVLDPAGLIDGAPVAVSR